MGRISKPSEEKECCIKCGTKRLNYGVKGYRPIEHCEDLDCNCHTLTESKPAQECKCLCHGSPPNAPTKGGLKLWCLNCNAEPQNWQHKPAQEGWEKRFDKEYVVTHTNFKDPFLGFWKTDKNGVYIKPKEVKQFIAQVIQEEREALREKVKEMWVDYGENPTKEREKIVDSYNQALDDVLDLLDSQEEKSR